MRDDGPFLAPTARDIQLLRKGPASPRPRSAFYFFAAEGLCFLNQRLQPFLNVADVVASKTVIDLTGIEQLSSLLAAQI
jgi:hypothetical protein